MCKFKSGIILKNKIVLAPEGNESHYSLLESLKIADTYTNASKKFVRAELVPPNGKRTTPVEGWKYIVDQDVVPDWYEADPARYETDFRNAVREYMKEALKDVEIIADMAWTKIKTDGDLTYYLLDDSMCLNKFGNTNNYATSDVRKLINNSELAKKLKKEFGDRLVPITTDLLSLDGLGDYGTVEGDTLALLTFDLYRECRKKIKSIGLWFWLATPHSTPSGYGARLVQYVNSGGGVDDYWCGYGNGAVRPFFILKG